ncbi:hypothetical protein I307_00132 [Cryptococcus deuterogattii 99/473]|uniref:Zinc finger PHD-type domain-containing protein n=1 Tax=Cryptococcus deuterogattii Ram5 TaxID=1296110 RepID=A0A0D0VG37_9TREE|nr:hypothetical protein I313_00671 [Cryptococcus deuterogattii Ram5]KIY60333.1 hypothetical protein I307_00132 [Cryptococcus deuterogattii 99/473]
MAGPVIYDTPFDPAMPNSLGQELMTDWNPTLGSFAGSSRRRKNDMTEHTIRSPYQNSPDSPYLQGQTVIITNPTPYHLPYPTISGSHLQPVAPPPHRHPVSPLAQPQNYYPHPNDDARAYAAWQSGSPNGFAESSFQHPMTSGLAVPFHYVPNEEKMSKKKKGKQPMREAEAVNRSRALKRLRSTDSLRSSKKLKREDGTQSQLLTPPSTSGGEIAWTPAASHIQAHAEDMMTPIDEAPEILVENESARTQDDVSDPNAKSSHRPLVITRHHEEGRKLGLLGIARGELEESKSPEEETKSPRLKTIDVVETDESGKASLATKDVLETEIPWFEENGKVTPPSSPARPQLQTPAAIPTTTRGEEADDLPEVNSQKVARRLQSFFESPVNIIEQPLVSTRIEMFGRVAVRKSTALSFLQLSTTDSAVEEMKMGEESWGEHLGIPPVRATLRPMWPDDEAPWALAGGVMKDRLRREEGEKEALLRRYLEMSSDDSEDEEYEPVYPFSLPSTTSKGKWGRGRGKTVISLMPEKVRECRRRRDDGSARAALLGSLRSRAVPLLPQGVVACVCGNNNANEMGSMVSCAACKTWHHLVCNGIDDISKIGPNWWCSSCNASASGMRTPVHAYTPTRSHSTLGDPRSSAVKSDIDHIALAPSPMFVNNISSARTPVSRTQQSPQRPHHSRILSSGSDMWAFQDDAVPPSTPVPVLQDRYSTPRINDTPFDVTSTPSRHLDFNFGQPSLFALTPLGGRSRVPSTMLIDGTPVLRATPRNVSGPGGPLEPMSVPSRADFFRELNKGNAPHSAGPTLSLHPSGAASAGAGDRENTHATSSPRWPSLLSAHNLSPSPFGGAGHRRTLSGNKLSSIRSSSRCGLGMGVPEEKEEE